MATKAKATSTKSKTKRATSSAAAKTTSGSRVTRLAVAPARKKSSASGELVLGALVAELVGTFALTTALLNSGGNITVAAITVLVLTMVLSRLSGGHVNPAVTIAMWATKQISVIKAAGYVVAQILGAMLALVVVTQFVHATPIDPTTGQSVAVFTAADISGQWRPFFAELLGAMVLGMGAAAAVMGRKNSHEAGFIVGGSLLVGLIIAALGSASLVNPAVAVGLSAYHFDNWWTVMAYAAGPIVGAVAGAWLYKLLQWDVTGEVPVKE